MVITALLVTVLLAEHRWQEMVSSSSSLLGNLNKRTIQAEMDFRRSVVQLPAQNKKSELVARSLSSWILETLKDRDCKASVQTFLLLSVLRVRKFSLYAE